MHLAGLFCVSSNIDVKAVKTSSFLIVRDIFGVSLYLIRISISVISPPFLATTMLPTQVDLTRTPLLKSKHCPLYLPNHPAQRRDHRAMLCVGRPICLRCDLEDRSLKFHPTADNVRFCQNGSRLDATPLAIESLAWGCSKLSRPKHPKTHPRATHTSPLFYLP